MIKSIILPALFMGTSVVGISGNIQSNSEQLRVNVNKHQFPVLTNQNFNPVMEVSVASNNELSVIKQLTFSLYGSTKVSDIIAVFLCPKNDKGRADTTRAIRGMIGKKGVVTFDNLGTVAGNDSLSYWVSVKLNPKMDLLNRLQLRLSGITTQESTFECINQFDQSLLRPGVAVRKKDQDGVNTSRIPGLELTNKGTLIAVYDARYENARDLQGPMDIAINRSFDGGNTWEPMQIVLDMEEWGGLPQRFNGVSDANIIVNRENGDIFVAGLWMHGILDRETGKWIAGLTEENKSWIHQWHAKGSQPGLGVKETSQFIIARSKDDGKTWSTPVNITSATKRPEWWLYAPAPGHGLTMSDGTLVIPTQGRDKTGLPFSNITWSKDGGDTWYASDPAYSNTTECMAVELKEKQIMLNMRDNTNVGNKTSNGRRVCVTNDLGENWTEHPSSHKALIEPVCMAAIHRHQFNRKKREPIYFFSNPNTMEGRYNITVKASTDYCETWPETHSLLLDEGYSAGYSCITSMGEKSIGILYESSCAHLVFQKISVNEILGRD